MRHSGKTQMAPGYRRRIDFEPAPQGQGSFLAVLIHQDSFTQLLADLLDSICIGRWALVRVPITELGQADETCLVVKGDLTANSRPWVSLLIENNP